MRSTIYRRPAQALTRSAPLSSGTAAQVCRLVREELRELLLNSRRLKTIDLCLLLNTTLCTIQPCVKPRAHESAFIHLRIHTKTHKHACGCVLSLTNEERQVGVARLDRLEVRQDKLAGGQRRSTYRAPALCAPWGEKCTRISFTAAGRALVNTDAMARARKDRRRRRERPSRHVEPRGLRSYGWRLLRTPSSCASGQVTYHFRDALPRERLGAGALDPRGNRLVAAVGDKPLQLLMRQVRHIRRRHVIVGTRLV